MIIILVLLYYDSTSILLLLTAEGSGHASSNKLFFQNLLDYFLIFLKGFEGGRITVHTENETCNLLYLNTENRTCDVSC